MEDVRNNSDHWKLYNLPPFFTLQPAPSTLEKQTNLWISLLLDHASYHATHSPAGVSQVARYYHPRSDIFRNTQLHRSLPASAARKVLAALIRAYPNHAVRIVHDANACNDEVNKTSKLASGISKIKLSQVEKSSSNDKGKSKHHSHYSSSGSSVNKNSNDTYSDDIDEYAENNDDDDTANEFGVFVTTVAGGFTQLERSLQNWILEVGGGTTTTMLAKKGVIMTFDELAHAKCLTYISTPINEHRANVKRVEYLPRSSSDDVPVGDVGALSEEEAVRLFLQILQGQQLSITRPYKISLFNMDGSDTQPYQGVKFGGE